MSKRRHKQVEQSDNEENYRTNSYRKTVVAKTDKQLELIHALKEYPVVFSIGSPGSGKTYLSVCQAVKDFEENKINKIVLVRPAVTTENFGFLPGTLKEKLDPYMKPLYDSLLDRWNPRQVENMMKIGGIEIFPLAYMRGVTFSNCYVILDEAQNTTIEQMKMFLTRLGENVKVAITGDLTQSDIHTDNGLHWALKKLNNSPYIKIVEFGLSDVVRSNLAKEILRLL